MRPHPVLTALTLFNNFHLIHHLYPGVPFYRLSRIWYHQEDFLRHRGVEVRTLFGRRDHTRTAPAQDYAPPGLTSEANGP